MEILVDANGLESESVDRRDQDCAGRSSGRIRLRDRHLTQNNSSATEFEATLWDLVRAPAEDGYAGRAARAATQVTDYAGCVAVSY